MPVCSLSNSVHNAFATKHLFRDCFPRNFKYRLFQRKRTLSQFAWYVGQLQLARPGVVSNDLSTRKRKPKWANSISPTRGSRHANQIAPRVPSCFISQTRESVRFRWNSLYLKLRGKQSRNKCFVAKALWTELLSERTDMDLQHLFFDSTEELSRQGYFQWIYSLRSAGTPEISVQPCLSFSSQGHPSTVFCKISVQISKYRLKFSTAPERLNISG